MSSSGPRIPKSWERYGSLKALVRGECANYDRPRKQCLMTGRECDKVRDGQPRMLWQSPMCQRKVTRPRPAVCTNLRQAREAAQAVEDWAATREQSGQGECSWFDKTIAPIVPGHLGGGVLDKGESDEGRRKPQRPGAEQRAARNVRDQPADHLRVVR